MVPADARSGGVISWRVRLFVTVATLLAVALAIPIGYVVADTVGVTAEGSGNAAQAADSAQSSDPARSDDAVQSGIANQSADPVQSGDPAQSGDSAQSNDNAQTGNLDQSSTVTVRDYAVRQGGNCTEVRPLTSDEPVKTFYDYRSPFVDDEYANATGDSYSSEGTRDLQVPNSSVLFLLHDGNGTVSLIAVHGALNETSDGGSASFDLSGLPENGTWAVKDDGDDHERNPDNWTQGNDTAAIDWTWDDSRTDGFAFAGLGEEFTVTIEPAFNENAMLFGEHFDGSVQNWTVLANTSEGANGTEADPVYNRTSLSLTDNVSITPGACPPDSLQQGESTNDDSDGPDNSEDSEAEGETETESEPESDPDTETEMDPEPNTDAETDTGAEMNSESGEPEPDAEAQNVEDTGSSAPQVEAMVDRIGASDDFVVEWVATDVDDDLSVVTVELYDGGSVVANADRSVSGSSAVGETSISGANVDSVRVVVSDDEGNRGDIQYDIGSPATPES